MIARPKLAGMLGLPRNGAFAVLTTGFGDLDRTPFSHEEAEIARLTHDAIRRLESQPWLLPGVALLERSDVQAALVAEVESRYRSAQTSMPGIGGRPDIATIVARATVMVVQQTIDIPRILVVPKGEIRTGFRPFRLELDGLRYEAPSETLWVAHLQTGQVDRIGIGAGVSTSARSRDDIVSALIEFDDVL